MEKERIYSIKIKGWKEDVSGVLIDAGTDFILIHSIFSDYMLDGYMVISKKFIKSISRNDEEKFVEKVLIANDKINIITSDIPLDLEMLIEYLQKEEITFGIVESKQNIFHIGRVCKIMKASFYLIPLNKKGQWMEKPLLHRFNSIRIITLNTDYINSLMAFSNKNQ